MEETDTGWDNHRTVATEKQCVEIVGTMEWNKISLNG